MTTNLVEEQEKGITEGTKYEDRGNNEFQYIVSLYQRKDLFDHYGNHPNHSKKLEYLEGLVKLARKRNLDVDVHRNQVAIVHPTHAIKRVSVNRAHRNKTLHLTIEINQAMIKGLMDRWFYVSYGNCCNIRYIYFLYPTSNGSDMMRMGQSIKDSC